MNYIEMHQVIHGFVGIDVDPKPLDDLDFIRLQLKHANLHGTFAMALFVFVVTFLLALPLAGFYNALELGFNAFSIFWFPLFVLFFVTNRAINDKTRPLLSLNREKFMDAIKTNYEIMMYAKKILDHERMPTKFEFNLMIKSAFNKD